MRTPESEGTITTTQYMTSLTSSQRGRFDWTGSRPTQSSPVPSTSRNRLVDAEVVGLGDRAIIALQPYGTCH